MYTIGYSKYNIKLFINKLKKYNINVLVDVRSMPYSKRFPSFNREILQNELKKNNIKYIYMGKELGARREDVNSYTDGRVDFEKVVNEEIFIEGINRLILGKSRGYNIVLMCSENNPMECHRTILISRELTNRGVEIKHIYDDFIINQKDIEEELVNKYFPNKNQLNFLEEEIDYNTMLKESYKKKSYEIAFLDN